jgi:hypothetical protein
MSAEFRAKCLKHGIIVCLAAPKHQEQNGICKQTWQSLCNITFAFLNHARVDSHHFGDLTLEHAWKICNTLPIKGLTQDGTQVTPFFLHHGSKPSIWKLLILFCPAWYMVHEQQKMTNRTTKLYTNKNNPQRAIPCIHVGIPRGQAGYLLWEPRPATLL